MKESVLLNDSIDFSTKIISLVKRLRDSKETIVSNQIAEVQQVLVQTFTKRNKETKISIDLSFPFN